MTLSGDLGAGKTTFMQGLLRGLGVTDPVTSPTYALEQRYDTDLGTLSHIDLYRLTETGAKTFLSELDDDVQLRCIEWPERADVHGDIEIALRADVAKAGRELTITYKDMALPTEQDVALWRDEVSLPQNVCEHCDAVADLITVLAEQLLTQGIPLRPLALRRAAQVHDLLRFMDFTPEATHPETWAMVKAQYENLPHETACAAFLRERNYPELADIVAVHGLKLPSPARTTIEQKLLFYADKRVAQDTVVSLDERFADFRTRYTDGKKTKEGEIWLKEAKSIEAELFPLGPLTC